MAGWLDVAEEEVGVSGGIDDGCVILCMCGGPFIRT